MTNDFDRSGRVPSGMPPLPPLPPAPLYPSDSDQSRIPARNVRSADQTKSRRRRFKIAAWVAAPILLVSGLIAGLEYVAWYGEPIRNELGATLDDLHSTVQQGDLIIAKAGALEPGLQDDIAEELDNAVATHDATDNPFVYAMPADLRDRLEVAIAAKEDLSSTIEPLRHAIEMRDEYFAQVASAEEEADDSKSLVEKSDGNVTDDSTRTTLSSKIAELQALVDEPVDETSSLAFATQRDRIRNSVSSGLAPAFQAVEASMRQFDDEEKQAELKDPANYASISDRDWKLVERNADSYTGKKYVIYGYVTQADGAMGSYGIRANTSGEQFGKWYEYDTNTIIYGADPDLLSTVVEDDLIQMLVEVQGSSTYDTTIGGTATAVMVLAYDIEIIGSAG